ncbi:MAG: hypothetical protein EXR75_15730 [Myxococcales bacterium]|nr:hypothetical protein [Myxococcales bacterium]
MTRSSLPRRIQARLVQYYGLEDVPDVGPFLAMRDEAERERVLVRETDEGIELRVELPRDTIEPDGPLSFDRLCQVVEGVSHFVLIAERARCGLPITLLELELQAEVDKFVLLGVARSTRCSARALAELRCRLFTTARYVDERDSEAGQRYRLASRLAWQFACAIERDYLRATAPHRLREALRQFFRAGQTTKLELALAA